MSRLANQNLAAGNQKLSSKKGTKSNSTRTGIKDGPDGLPGTNTWDVPFVIVSVVAQSTAMSNPKEGAANTVVRLDVR